MSKKKSLLNLFTQDTQHNYHIVRTTEPNGHLIYLMKNGLELNTDSLEFKPTSIAEELVKECDVKIEKFAPSIFFTDEADLQELKIKLNFRLYESEDFSKFVDTIKLEYRILEVNDSLLYKKDPDAYNESKQKEHNDHQKELWEDYVKQVEDKKKSREDYLLEYDNNLMRLLKEQFDNIIEYEKRDFNFALELEKIVGNLIDDNTWIKINEIPFICKIEVCSLEKDSMNVFLTDNNENLFTATLRFDKTYIVTENIVKLNIDDVLPVFISDYNILSQLYNIDFTEVEDWEFKNETDRIIYVIDYLVPILKVEKDDKQQKLVESILKENEEIEKNEEK